MVVRAVNNPRHPRVAAAAGDDGKGSFFVWCQNKFQHSWLLRGRCGFRGRTNGRGSASVCGKPG